MITLLEKLNTINFPKIKPLLRGSATTIEELWDNLIEEYLPTKENVSKWNNLILQYIATPNTMFAIRGFNYFKKKDYDKLRRGFLTITDKDFSFFYTDNFFAAYFYKMVVDNFVPSLDEFYNAMITRKFPCRFGPDTSFERELMAIPRGKDIRVNSAGFKIAHIIPVGKNYYFNGKTIGIKEILQTYFPNGKRVDWKEEADINGTYFARHLFVKNEAKMYIIAHFLRFVHPLNYFLAPKKNLQQNKCCKDIAEYDELLSYAQYRFLKKYGDMYYDYLKLIMYNGPINTYDNGKSIINILMEI